MSTRWRPWAEARDYIRSLEFNSTQEWRDWAATADRPYDIPSTPNREYKEHWNGWSDFLGTKLGYAECKRLIAPLKIKSSYEYFKKLDKLPRGLAKRPDRVFKRTEEWISWGDFLGVTPKEKTKRLDQKIRED